MESDIVAMLSNLRVSEKFKFPNIVPFEGI